MELLNEKVISSKSFKLLQLMLKNCSAKDNSSKFMVPYDEFREAVVLFVEKIMSSFLENTKYCNDKFSCIIKKLPYYSEGEFNPENNVIIINETVIKDIYLGKINSMTTIFHELNHFKSKYDIKLGKINNDIIRDIKEELLRVSSQDPFDEMNSIKKGHTFINDDYYKCNYTVYSGEKIAEINGINNLILFIEIANIKLSEQCLQELKNRIKSNTVQYNNHLRDLRLNFNFNNYFLNFEKAFDVMIKFNPDWLEIPQLKIEYYLNKDGKVIKRTSEELEERLKTETDENIKRYIQYLLTPNKSKFPSDDTNLKIYKSKLLYNR